MNKLKISISKLPESPGVYMFFASDSTLLYVGKSVSIKKRVSSYFTNRNLGAKTDALVSKIYDVKHIKVFSEFEALLLESDLIRSNKPFYNVIAKDDKSPIYIRITNDFIPLVEITRKPKRLKGDFVKGPFPSGKITRAVLRNVRQIFPYCQHKNPRKPCLFVHLGLCMFPYAKAQSRESYMQDITKIKKLLSGKSKLLVRQLKAHMQEASANLRYEDAQVCLRY